MSTLQIDQITDVLDEFYDNVDETSLEDLKTAISMVETIRGHVNQLYWSLQDSIDEAEDQEDEEDQDSEDEDAPDEDS